MVMILLLEKIVRIRQTVKNIRNLHKYNKKICRPAHLDQRMKDISGKTIIITIIRMLGRNQNHRQFQQQHRRHHNHSHRYNKHHPIHRLSHKNNIRIIS